MTDAMNKLVHSPGQESLRDDLLTVRDLDVHIVAGASKIHAVKNATLTVKKAECIGIVGESGSGKSTLARAVSRLMPNVTRTELTGEVEFNGTNMLEISGDDLRKLRRNNGFSMVFQDPLSYLNPTKRIWRQIDEALPGVTARRARRERIISLLNEVGLPNPEKVAGSYPHELSGGMRQRVMIAIALASEPLLLIADEPTTALDSTVQLLVLDTLRRLHRDRGMAMIVITHDLGVIAELCDRVYVMRGGQIIESGETASVFKSPSHEYTARLLELSRATHTGYIDQDTADGQSSQTNTGSCDD